LIAVLVPAHNEEEVIDRSLSWAVADAGRENVFLVADDCTDDTVRFASYWLPSENILEIERSGRGPALLKATHHFDLLNRYDGIFFADADSLIVPGAIEAFRSRMGDEIAAVVGHITVSRFQDDLIGNWRRYQYFWAFNLMVRASDFYGGCFQNTPGCCTVYSTRALKRIDHDPLNPAEDMDFCFQIHRKGLGKIVFEPTAWVETADPMNLSDYSKQILRWGRGWWYNVIKHKMGLKFRPVDLLVDYITLSMVVTWIRLFLLIFLGIEYVVTGTGSLVFDVVAISFIFDVALISTVSVLSAFRRKLGLLRFIPIFPFMLVLDALLYLLAFVTMKKGRSAIWVSPTRIKGV
jgi:poly-beta-1,6-N-acetyl-D-glucosamine synthase